MYKSSDLCYELIPSYSKFEETKYNSFKGYKLVEKKNLNYYSIVTGQFRYKSGKIDRSSYSKLYQKDDKFYNKKLHNKLSVFKEKEDAIEALEKFKEISDRKCELVLLEIVITGDLEKALLSNSIVEDREVYVGNIIESVREV